TDGTTPKVLADISTKYPGQSVPFANFPDQPVISHNQVAFVGGFSNTVGDQGIFLAPAAGGALQTLVSGTTPVPGGKGSFGSFFAPSLSNGQVAFFGRDELGKSGVFQSAGGPVSVVASESTMVPGTNGNFSSFTFHPSISGDKIAFTAADALAQ